MDDLISREEAISTIKSMLYQTALNSVNGDEKAAQLYADIADNRVEIWLKLVDSVDAVPVVHGRWEERRVDCIEETTIDAWQSAKCTNCGKYHTTPYLYYFTDYKFCPNCGAKMDGERRESE